MSRSKTLSKQPDCGPHKRLGVKISQTACWRKRKRKERKKKKRRGVFRQGKLEDNSPFSSKFGERATTTAKSNSAHFPQAWLIAQSTDLITCSPLLLSPPPLPHPSPAEPKDMHLDLSNRAIIVRATQNPRFSFIIVST